MEQLQQFKHLVEERWSQTGPRLRLLFGAMVVALIGLAGLTPTSILSQSVSWPFAAFIAAACWGRTGLAFAPMFILVVFGFIQDETAFAPLGIYGLLNLLVFGLSALLHQTFDTERSSTLSYYLPLIVIAVGFGLLWVFASIVSSYPVRLLPILGALITTLLTHMIIAPVFDLGIRYNATGQGSS